MFMKYLNETIYKITLKFSMKLLFKNLFVSLKKNDPLKNTSNNEKITIIVK